MKMKTIGRIAALPVLVCLLFAVGAYRQAFAAVATEERGSYGGINAGMKYSPLAQTDRESVKRLSPLVAQSSGAEAMAIWRGIFTEAQAESGRMAFDRYCVRCHGEAASGTGDAPAIVGSHFRNNWLEDSVGSLLNRIHNTMPSDAPGTLTVTDAAALTSYVLRLNGYPAGMEPLRPNLDALMRIRIVGKEGPGLVPNFSNVVVVGCLVHGPDGLWTVTKSTEPVRTRDKSVNEQVKAKPVGTLTFQLIYVAAAKPERYLGQRVLVEGLLIRDAAESKLNVESIAPAGSRCET